MTSVRLKGISYASSGEMQLYLFIISSFIGSCLALSDFAPATRATQPHSTRMLLTYYTYVDIPTLRLHTTDINASFFSTYAALYTGEQRHRNALAQTAKPSLKL